MKGKLESTCLAMILVAAGCGGMSPGEDEYREALPTSEQLALSVPGAKPSQQQEGKLTQALVGQRALLYLVTRDTSIKVNATLWITLNIIRSITVHPPTKVGVDYAVWGSGGHGLGLLSWKLYVKRVSPGKYNYTLSARRKTKLAGAFSTIVSGTSTRGTSSVFAGYSGSVTADADALHALAPIRYPTRGRAVVHYDTTGTTRSVKMALKGYSKLGFQRSEVNYAYLDRADRSGEFSYAVETDIHLRNGAREQVTVKSKWNAAGAGKGLATISGGDLPSGVVGKATECWDSAFRRVFYSDTVKIHPDEGSASRCAL